MHRYFWLAEHPAATLALVATVILAFAWPLQNVPACVSAAVMMALAAGITIRAHFLARREKPSPTSAPYGPLEGRS